MNRLITAVSLVLTAITAVAQDSTGVTHRLELSGRGAYVLPSNSIVRGGNSYGARTRSAFGGNVEYSFSFGPESRYGRYYPSAYQGIGIGVTGFDSNRTTGTPVNLYVLQGMRIASLTDRLSLDYEWNFGVSAFWHKNSGESAFNPDEVNGFGSRFNAYIDLGFKLSYELTGRFALTAGVSLSHYSNGNTDYPNPGVNVLSGRLGLLYRFGNTAGPARHDWSSYTSHVSYDLTAYGAWKKSAYDSGLGGDKSMIAVPGHFGVAGLNFNPLWHFNPMIAAGVSFDMQYDDGANLTPHYVTSSPYDDPKFYRQPFSSRVMAGLSLRAELQMPLFAVNVGIGHSLYAPGGEDLRGWYQMFTLKTFITRSLYLSTGYRLVRFNTPGNLMLGVGWRFNAR